MFKLFIAQYRADRGGYFIFGHAVHISRVRIRFEACDDRSFSIPAPLGERLADRFGPQYLALVVGFYEGAYRAIAASSHREMSAGKPVHVRWGKPIARRVGAGLHAAATLHRDLQLPCGGMICSDAAIHQTWFTPNAYFDWTYVLPRERPMRLITV
jgi:hypothetical protein